MRVVQTHQARITSTYVENTMFSIFFNTKSRDHLHIRGEHNYSGSRTRHSQGSPPHTWRTLVSRLAPESGLRITSTYVENTRLKQNKAFMKEDHLHIRGEHLLKEAKQQTLLGSPPHTWRTLSVKCIGDLSLRITSTYVENTTVLWNGKPTFQDHLHIRGEHLSSLLTPPIFLGTPPHTWRTLISISDGFPKFGITSTYVENTHD